MFMKGETQSKDRGGKSADEAEATQVADALVPALRSPADLHERRDRNRHIGHGNVTSHKRGGWQGKRAEDARATTAKILDTAIEFPRGRGRRLYRRQAPGVYIEHLWKALMLTPLVFADVLHLAASFRVAAPQ